MKLKWEMIAAWFVVGFIGWVMFGLIYQFFKLVIKYIR